MTDPIPQFSHFVSALKERQPNLAYLHVIEPRVSGNQDLNTSKEESNDFLRDIWQPSPYISAGGHSNREGAGQVAEEKGVLVAFGRIYISNVSPFFMIIHMFEERLTGCHIY